jgi:excisionase family DNA binding protein
MEALRGERLLYTMAEAAAVLGIGRSTVYELARTGALPVMHVGRAVRVPREAIEEWVREQVRRGVHSSI